MDSEKVAMRVSKNSILVNVILAVGKLIAGVLGNSAAMVSDAVHSASDVFSTIVVMIGVKIAGKESDHDHQYGHERLESVAALILAIVLAATGCGIGYSGLQAIMNQSNGGTIAIPTMMPLIAAIVSIALKEAMYWYTILAARKIHSDVLKADAWHHRSDAMSSVGSLVGIAGAKMGYPIFDSIASVVICLFILKVSYDIFRDAIGKMTDKACDVQMVDEMVKVVNAQEGVLALDDIKTRMFGNKVYVDIEIGVDGELKLIDAHEIAERVHDEIEAQFAEVKHCMVHVNPYES
ncbi:MAG: cation transporter [Eubacterium sp.]|nr:cation transporter [Eubacterium sp.]